MIFLIAFIAIALCAIGLSIGKILTGKNRLHCKRCGTPEKPCPCKKKTKKQR